MESKVKAIVVDTDMQARIRLKTATQPVVQFESVDMYGKLDEVLTLLKQERLYDIIFVSRRFSQTEVDRFIAQAKDLPGGMDSAYVIVLDTSKQDSHSVTQNVLAGADGFLLEPFSVDNLVDMTKLAARVKAERSQQREAAALRFLVHDVMKAIDKIAYLKRADIEAGTSIRKLRGMCEVFATLDKETREIYYEIMPAEFEKAKLPVFPDIPRSYVGASKRVRQKMEEKLLRQLEEAMESESSPKEEAPSESS